LRSAISCNIFFINEIWIDYKKAGRSGRLTEEFMPASLGFAILGQGLF
jgi:hypothetical protein